MGNLFAIILLISGIVIVLSLMAYVFDHVEDLVWYVKRFLLWLYRKIREAR